MQYAGEVISLESFIAAAKQQLRLGETGDYDIWFESLCDEAIRRLGCLSLQKKNVCTFTILDNKIKLPKGFNKVLGLRLGDGSNCLPGIYVDMPFIKTCGCSLNPSVYIADTFEIDGQYLIFQADIGTATEATIAYTSYNIDSEGLMQGQLEYESAVKYFVCYHFCLQNFEKFPKWVIDEYWGQWLHLRRIIMNNDSVRSFQQTKAQIQEFMSALVTDKNSWLLTA